MADFTALRGIVCPVVSPCTSNEGVDYDSLQENLARLLRAPITGFYVCGGTGDGSRLTFAERCRTAELTIAQTRAAGRRTIVHVGQTLQRHALELAEHAMTLGADAVASVPPQGGWSETVAYYTALAAQAPVFIYYCRSSAVSHGVMQRLSCTVMTGSSGWFRSRRSAPTNCVKRAR